jgi:hypothetical protein
MASNNSELLPILKALREYIVKEYGVNYPPHVRGEDASQKALPDDWVGKLEPLSGGDTVGRSQHGSQGTKSTKAGSQGTDPYIHKSEFEAMLRDFSKHFVDGEPVQAGGPRSDGMHGAGGYNYPGDSRRIPTGLEKNDHEDDFEDGSMNGNDLEDDVEDVEEEEEDMDDMETEDGDEDMDEMNKNYMARSSDGINGLLKDIKGLLSSRQQDKQQYAELSGEINDLKKSVQKDVKDGIRKGLKSFNLNPSHGDMATRTDIYAERGSQFGVPSPTDMPDQRIGVEGESFQKSNEESNADEFVSGIEQIVQQTDTNDLRGHFKLVNGMRNQTGELTPQTLYYYPRPSNGRSN